MRFDVLNLFDPSALERGYLLPGATGEGEVLHGFPALPRAYRVGIEKSW